MTERQDRQPRRHREGNHRRAGRCRNRTGRGAGRRRARPTQADEQADEATEADRRGRRRAGRTRQAQAPRQLVAGARLCGAARPRAAAGRGRGFPEVAGQFDPGRRDRPHRVGAGRQGQHDRAAVLQARHRRTATRRGTRPADRRLPGLLHRADERRGDPRREGEADLGGGLDSGGGLGVRRTEPCGGSAVREPDRGRRHRRTHRHRVQRAGRAGQGRRTLADLRVRPRLGAAACRSTSRPPPGSCGR